MSRPCSPRSRAPPSRACSPDTRSPTSWGGASRLPVINCTWSAARSGTRCSAARLDLDFTTDARPDAILGVLDGWADTTWETGIEFGTVGAARDGLTLEITTFRADLYDGETRNPG